MRTRLLTFSPNMTLINEAMRFHHFPQPGPAAPARSWYQRCSPFVFIRQSLDLPPNIPVTSEPLGGWHYPTMEPPRALHVFISSLCFIFRKAGRRPWWAWKRVQTIALEAKGHPMLFVIKGKPRQEAGPGGLLLPSCSRQDGRTPWGGGREGLWVCATPWAIKRQLRIQMKDRRRPYHRCGNAFPFPPQSRFQVSWNKRGGHSCPHPMSEFHHIPRFYIPAPLFSISTAS